MLFTSLEEDSIKFELFLNNCLIILHFSEPALSSFDIEREGLINHSENEGLLSLSYLDSDNKDKMGTVCSANFSFEMSDMVCKKLGYQYGQWGKSLEREQFITQQ